MQFSELYDTVFRLMRDTGQDKYDLVTVKRWLNDGERRYCAITGYSVKKSTAITSVSGTAEYEFPADYKSLIAAFWNSDKLTETEIEDTIPSDSGTPSLFYVRNNYLGLFPVPTTTGTTVTIVYRSIGGAMAAADDEPEIPEEHHMAMVYYAAVLCSMEGDDSRLPLFQGKWNEIVGQAVQETVAKSYTSFPIVGGNVGPAESEFRDWGPYRGSP